MAQPANHLCRQEVEPAEGGLLERRHVAERAVCARPQERRTLLARGDGVGPPELDLILALATRSVRRQYDPREACERVGEMECCTRHEYSASPALCQML